MRNQQLDFDAAPAAAEHPAPALDTREAAPTTSSEELTLDGFGDDRGMACVATFVNGFASGWFFAVPEAFKEALDIRLAQRIFNGKQAMVLTQGKYYSFNHGDVVYDAPVYDLVWSEALKKIGLCVQVQQAVPSTIVTTKEYRTEDPVPVWEDGSDNPRKTKDKTVKLHTIAYKRTRMSYGLVRFDLLRPNRLRSKLEVIATYETDQELFVRFLQTGWLRGNDGTEHDFTAR